MPGDEGLGQSDVIDQLGDRRLAVGERRRMRSRFTSAMTLWKARNWRRSSGWTTAAAMVERTRAGDGDIGLRCWPSGCINDGLYQCSLMLFGARAACQEAARPMPAGRAAGAQEAHPSMVQGKRNHPTRDDPRQIVPLERSRSGRARDAGTPGPAGLRRRPHYTPPMERRTAFVLLAVFGTGVFLAGLELMITAVALPSILASLVDAAGSSAWIELRKASWIINGYLLVFILTMPMAGRLTDLWGARRLLIGALVIFIVGSTLAGMAQSLDQLIAARLIQAVGGGVLVPVGTAAASHLFGGAARPRALGVIGALTFLGMAAGPFLGAAILSSVHAEDALAGAGLADQPAGRRPRAVLAMGVLHQRADRHRGARRGLGRRPWLGHATPSRPGRSRRCVPVRCRAALRTGRPDAHRHDRDRRHGPGPDDRHGRPSRDLRPGRGGVRPARPPVHRSVHRTPPLPKPAVQRGDAGLLPHRLCVRHGHHRRSRLRGPCPVRRPGRAAAGTRFPGRGDRRRGPRLRLPGPVPRAPSREPDRARPEHRCPAGHVRLDAGDAARGGRAGPWRVRTRVRPDGDPAIHGRGGGGRPSPVRGRLGGRHGRPHGRHGRGPGHPDGLWVDHDRSAVRSGLRHPGRLSPVHPGRAARAAAQGSSRGGRA